MLGLLPGSPDFLQRTDDYDRLLAKPASTAIVRFVDDLLKRYPDVSERITETAWADGPMIRDANGGFINFSIRWDYYDKVMPFVISTARRDGLNCYDPQTATYYPAAGKPAVIEKYLVREPVTNADAAIRKARRLCVTEPDGKGQWHATLAGNSWHVWLGNAGDECNSSTADIARDGSTTICGFLACRTK